MKITDLLVGAILGAGSTIALAYKFFSRTSNLNNNRGTSDAAVQTENDSTYEVIEISITTPTVNEDHAYYRVEAEDYQSSPTPNLTGCFSSS